MVAMLAQWIDRQSWFHSLMQIGWMQKLASRILFKSLIRSYPSGVSVKITDAESLQLSDEIFQCEPYRRALELAGDVRMVIDLGCNIGFFCCYLHHYYGRTDFRGFGIDANVQVLEKAEQNLELNGLRGMELFHGLVGNMEENLTPDFFVHAAHPNSSQFIRSRTGKSLGSGWTKIEVPVLMPGELWRDQYGDTPIDLLKIDIVGSEGNLLRADPALFWQTRCIVLKWYKEYTEEEEIFPVLRDYGFTRHEALETGSAVELWFFSRGGSSN